MSDPSNSAAPLTVEELCKNLLAIKPGDKFEIRNPENSENDWREAGTRADWTPLQFVRQGYDVRPLPVKKFVLLFIHPDDCSEIVSPDYYQEIFAPDHKIGLRVHSVEASSITAAAALAAPQPGETFLAAVPYPEAQ